MAKSLVLLTSGFMVPESQWFSRVVKNPTLREQMINKDNGLMDDQEMSQVVSDYKVMSPKAFSETFIAHRDLPSFDTYIALVDALIDVFEDCSFNEFIKIQVYNNHLSQAGFSLVMSLLDGSFFQTYNRYAVLPSFFRLDSGITPEESKRRLDIYRDTLKKAQNTAVTMTQFLTELSANQPALSAFFRYVLTDSNRANHYA